ncbi:MAG: hypothetical protein OQK09_09070 [Colwellia sp.]|nr:hypothetical protein [Colwellia sp.]MCW9081649.1 hypothetical protein [Colwellia sp.]
MNKLAVLAFTLLVFFSTMLWYLANGSLNEYLKSQIQLQGQYYTKQPTQLSLADFSTNNGFGTFRELTLGNPENYQTKYALIIDEASVKLASPQATVTAKKTNAFKENHTLLISVAQLTLNKLTLNIEQNTDQTNNRELIAQIKSQLAQDYPELYPEISAKLYAEQNPQLNAEAYAKSHPKSGPIVEHKQTKKKRGKAQTKINIQAITINTLIVNTTHNDTTDSVHFSNIQLSPIGGEQGIVTNQLGGELLIALLRLPEHKENTLPDM